MAGQSTPGAQSESKWNPIKLKLKVRDGDPEEVEWATQEEAERTAIRAKQFDRANKERLQLQAEKQALEGLKAKAKAGDVDAMKQLGIDPDAYFKTRLEAEAKRLDMSEEQRQAETHKQESERLKAQVAAFEKREAARLQEQTEQRAWSELEPRLLAAIQKEQMVSDSHSWETVSRVAQEFLSAGLDVPPEQVVAEAAAREREQFDARLTKVPPALLWKRLTPDARKELMAIGVAEWKASKGAPPVAPPPPQQAGEPKGEGAPGLTPRAWLKSLGR